MEVVSDKPGVILCVFGSVPVRSRLWINFLSKDHPGTQSVNIVREEASSSSIRK